MNKKLLLVSGLCIFFFLSTITLWLAYSNADEERDAYQSDIDSLQTELEIKDQNIQSAQSTVNTSMELTNEINSTYQDFKDRAFLSVYVTSYYESNSYDNVVTVQISNFGETEASKVTGICGIYEESGDQEASDAFYIDLESVASGQVETRTYTFQDEEYEGDFSTESSINCYSYSADGGLPASKQVRTWSERIYEWESMADETTSPGEI